MARGSRCPQGPYVYWLSPLSQATNSSLWNQKPISRNAVSTESLACTTFLRRDGDVTSRPGATPNPPPPPHVPLPADVHAEVPPDGPRRCLRRIRIPHHGTRGAHHVVALPHLRDGDG